MNSKLIKTISCSLALFGGMALSIHAQLFWNPPAGSGSYSGTGGDGAWNNADTNFWNGSANVIASAGDNLVFEGSGTVTVGTGSTIAPSHGNLTFQNLTGNYTFNNGAPRMNNSGNLSATTGNGQTIRFNNGYQLQSGSNRTISHSGTGLLSISSISRHSGGGNTSITFDGTGNTTITGNTGNMGGTLTKNGIGTLTLGGTVTSFTGGIVLNNGAIAFTGAAPAATIMTWNDGTIHFDPDDYETVALSGALTKGTGSTFAFDFLNFNATAQGTFTLMNFASTTFTDVSDFSASNITYDAGLSGQFVLNADSLQFAVIPEPSTYALLLGIFTFGLLLWRKRKTL